MDKQDTLRNLLIAAAIFLTIMWVGPRLLPTPPQRPGPQTAEQQTPARQQPTGQGPIGTGATDGQRTDVAVATPSPSTTTGDEASAGFTVAEAPTEQTFSVGSAAANGVDKKAPPSPYRMRLVLSNVGASVESVTMTDHAEELESADRYTLLSMLEAPDGVRHRSLAVEKINVGGIDIALSDKKWHAGAVETLAGDRGQTVAFWIDILQAGEPALKLTRTLTLPQQTKQSGRHDLRSNLTVESLSARAYKVIVTYRGGLGIKRANARMDDRSVDWGVDTGGRVEGSRTTVAKIAGQNLPLISAADRGIHLSWAATANTYFTCTVAPLSRGPQGGNAVHSTKALAYDVDGDALTDNDATLRFVTAKETLSPQQSLSYPADVYLGQKEADAFREVSQYSRRNYYFQISKGFGWCTFTWLVEVMIWLLDALHTVVRDFGVAIIILVLIVRTLLHPITKKGQVNMVRMQHRMQEIQPKIEEIKKKYANDKARMNQEMMKLNINPAGQMITCLPMLIQMPIWIALYISLSNNISMRHEAFLFTWVTDLTGPDALYTFPSPIRVPLFGWMLPDFNLLPILLAIAMYFQQKLQPKPKPNPAMSDQQRSQQETMQKMGPIMSIMMLLIFYKMPSGLNLYIMSSSLFGTIEQWRIRKHIREREEAGTLHKEPDKPKVPQGQQEGRRKRSLVERLQRMAEDARKVQTLHPRKPRKR